MKQLAALLTLLLGFIVPAYAADTPISGLPNGNSVQAGDQIPVERGGANYRAQVPIGTSGASLGLLNTALTFSGADQFLAPVTFNLNPNAAPAAQTGTVAQFLNANGVSSRLEVDAYGAAAYVSGIRLDGTSFTPTTLQSGDEMGGFNVWGYNGTSVVGPRASFRAYANQNWTSGANGSYADVATTPNGATAVAEVIRFENDGGVTLPSSVTGGDKGAGTLNAAAIYANGTQLQNGNFTPGSNVTISGIWPNLTFSASGGGGSGNLGASASATNPQRSGASDTGLYSSAAGHVSVAVDVSGSGTQALDIFNGGINIPSGSVYEINGAQISCSSLLNGASGCSTATGTSGATTPLLNGNWTESGNPIFSGTVNFSGLAASELLATDGSKNITNVTALPNGTTATTQSSSDNSTKVATDAFVQTTASAGITVGTSASATNPQRSGQATTGLYSDTSNFVELGANSQPVVKFTNPSSAVNFLSISGAATGTSPSILATGTDTDVSFVENTTGLGEVIASGNQNYIFNINSNSLPNTRACLDNVITQAANCTILMVGDSLTYGLHSSALADQKTQSWPYMFASALNKLGIPASTQSWFGTSYAGASGLLEDKRISQGADWSQSGSYASIGGALIQATSGGTLPLAFTPGYTDSGGTQHSVPVDTCIIYYPKYTGLGSFSYKVDSGSPTTVNENASDAWGSVSVSLGSLGYHTLNVNWISGTAYIIGELCYNSTYKQVFVLNAGGSGGEASEMNSTIQTGGTDPWAPGNAICQLNPSLVFAEAGGNELLNSVTTATFLTNYQSLVNLSYCNSSPGPATSDVIALSYDHIATSYGSEAFQKGYIEQIATTVAATTPPTPFIDLSTRFNSYAQENTLGFKYSGDGIHDLAIGYQEWSNAILSGLSPVLRNVGGNPQIGDGANNLTVYEGETIKGLAGLNLSNTSANYQIGGVTALWEDNTNFNTVIGDSAFQTVSTLGTAQNNTVVGYQALNADTTGSQDTAIGYQALKANTTANANTALGYKALTANTTGTNNTCVGWACLSVITTAVSDTGVGTSALQNTTGNQNTAVGALSMVTDTSGAGNTALGYETIYANTTGVDNVAIGLGAGYVGTANTVGSNNTWVGFNAQSNANNYTNSTALGNGAIITASNAVVLGNSSITAIYGEVTSITGISDLTKKTNIKPIELGFEFIMGLKPIQYTKTNGDDTLRFGVGAQHVLKVLPKDMKDRVEAADPSHKLALVEKGSDGIYRMAYGELTAPMIHAIQEEGYGMIGLYILLAGNFLFMLYRTRKRHDRLD